jgi:hypothetical protein
MAPGSRARLLPPSSLRKRHMQVSLHAPQAFQTLREERGGAIREPAALPGIDAPNFYCAGTPLVNWIWFNIHRFIS